MGNSKSKRIVHSQNVKKQQQNVGKDNEKLERKEELEYAFKILDRTDAWINSCDNKLTLLVGICGVIFTLFITTESISKGYELVTSIIYQSNNLYSYLFLSALFILFLSYIVSIYHVISSVVARVNINKYMQEKLPNNSNLFFGSIASRQYREFKESLSNSSDNEKIDDVMAQIYINSLIAQKKYQQYNNSLIWIIISALMTLFVVIWGVVAF